MKNSFKSKARSGNYGQSDGMPSQQGQSDFYDTTKRPISIQIFNKVGKCVGFVEGETFIKRVHGKKHLLRYPPAWANDVSIIEELLDRSIETIIIQDAQTGIIYRTTLLKYLEYGKVINRGHGDQMYLELKYWETEPANHCQMELTLN